MVCRHEGKLEEFRWGCRLNVHPTRKRRLTALQAALVARLREGDRLYRDDCWYVWGPKFTETVNAGTVRGLLTRGVLKTVPVKSLHVDAQVVLVETERGGAA